MSEKRKRAPSIQQKMKIWNDAQTTDLTYTKKFDFPFEGTAIVPQYLIRRATETWGPAGIGWGFDLLYSEIIQGAPILIAGQAQGHELVHTARVAFWYMDGGEKRIVYGTGHTPFVFTVSQGSRIKTDFEYEKKSITDAITKAMSFLGFGADIRMGMLERPDYYADRTTDLKTQAAIAKLEKREAFLETYQRVMDAIRASDKLREVERLRREHEQTIEARGHEDEKQAFRKLVRERITELQPKRETANG